MLVARHPAASCLPTTDTDTGTGQHTLLPSYAEPTPPDSKEDVNSVQQGTRVLTRHGSGQALHPPKTGVVAFQCDVAHVVGLACQAVDQLGHGLLTQDGTY